jgi:D-amino-acid dehydrogenase
VTSRIVVVGGGAVGASAAYRVACQGGEAILVDRQDQGQATAAGAGIISPGTGFKLLELLTSDSELLTGYQVVGALHVATTEQEQDRLDDVLGELLRRRGRGFSHVGDAEIVDARTARAGFPALGPVRAAIHVPGAPGRSVVGRGGRGPGARRSGPARPPALRRRPAQPRRPRGTGT